MTNVDDRIALDEKAISSPSPKIVIMKLCQRELDDDKKMYTNTFE